MFSLVSVPQVQESDQMLICHKNDNDTKKWSIGYSDLIETMLRVNNTSYQDGQQGYSGLLNEVAMIYNV